MTLPPLTFLRSLPADHDAGRRPGLTSVCSAHPEVIAAAMEEARATGQTLCIEATCNQVNQDGGYTGMTPADFRAYVGNIARAQGFDATAILFGGDHLGPNPWRKRPAAEAMEKALVMTRAYAAAGFGKIHLDASMSCAGDPVPLPPATIATRAARLAEVAEAGAKEGGHPPPLYIIGTEVPVPGGAAEEIEGLVVTTPHDAAETIALHRVAFADLGIAAALDRVVGLVVQPGVEFGHANVIPYAPDGASDLVAWRAGLVFEAHSTDYQTPAALAALVKGGFAILKVGPGLTFAWREALYGLDLIAGVIAPGYRAGLLPEAMEALMLSHPADWEAYYHGTADHQRMQRHYSYSDRIRYYWARPEAQAAVDRLFEALDGHVIPEPLISQFLPCSLPAVMAGALPPHARALARHAVRLALTPYSAACAED